MLPNYYVLAKIGVDTAENGLLEVWGKFNSLFIRLLNHTGAVELRDALVPSVVGRPGEPVVQSFGGPLSAGRTDEVLGCINNTRFSDHVLI